MRASREMVLALEICIGGVVYFLERRQVCMIFTLERCRDGMHTIYGCDPREMHVEMVWYGFATLRDDGMIWPPRDPSCLGAFPEIRKKNHDLVILD